MPQNNFPVIEQLNTHHNRSNFNCGAVSLEKYIKTQASQDARRSVSSTYVLHLGNLEVIGYYSLASAQIDLSDLPAHIAKKLPLYPQMPAFLLGRLAVDRLYHRKGWGHILLIDALKRCYQLSRKVGACGVVVDAINRSAKNFYLNYQFIQLMNNPMQLFLPMSTIAKLP